MPCRPRYPSSQQLQSGPQNPSGIASHPCRSSVPVPVTAIRTISLLEWATMYLDHAQARFVVKTYKEKQHAFRQLFKAVDPHLDAALLHKGDALAHFTEQARSRSGYAANKDRKNLAAAWSWAVEHIKGFPGGNPFMTVRFSEERSPRRVPTIQEFWAVYAAAESDQDRTMLLCFLHLAARRNEIFHLRREDVDFARRQVRLFTRKSRDCSMRCDWLPLTAKLHLALEEHLAVTFGEWAFPNPQNGLPYFERGKWLPRLCRIAVVSEFGLHGIRHLSASILAASGASLLDIQTILRHSNLTTTQRYIHRLESVRKAMEVFE
jgi:integrase